MDGDAKPDEAHMRTASGIGPMADTGVEGIIVSAVATRRESRPTQLVDVIVA